MCRLLLALVALLIPVGDAAAEQVATDDRLKAAYIFNIAKFVSWNDEPRSVRLCIDTESTIGGTAKSLDGRDLGDGRSMSILHRTENLDDCHMYFGKRLPGGGTGTRPLNPQVVSVADHMGALRDGFVIQLFVMDGRLRFTIDGQKLTDAPFRISSKLLRLARDPETD